MDSSDPSIMTGTVNGNGWSADLGARIASPAKSTPFAGKYTLILPGPADGDPAVPQGDGYAAATVSSKGSLKVAGALGDGTKFTQSITVSQDGSWPLFFTRKGQQILGFLDITGLSDGDGGQLTWTKSATSGKLFPDAFSLQIDVLGSEFETPASSIPILNFSDGVITLTGGDLSSDLANPITIDAKNRITSETDLKATLNKTSGLFSGTVLNPDTKRRIKFNGAILQNANTGSGFFLGTDQSGRVTLEPQ
jgi:hypothetical protein